MDLAAVPLIDHHAHNLLTAEAAAQTPFRAAFTEAYDPAVLNDHAQHTLFYRRSLREIAAVLECDPAEEAVLARRNQLGHEELAARFFRAANLEMVMLDDGFLPGRILPTDWHDRLVPTRRILRMEALAEDLLGPAKDFDDFLARYRAALDPPPANVVGLKTIAAYRTGLDMGLPDRDAARAAWNGWKRSTPARRRPRLADLALLDYLLDQAMEVAARHRLPVQVHTGFGDPDLDLRLANPLHLRRVFEDARFKSVPIMLLHASYPFAREAGYLAAVYPNAYLDLGLAVPSLSVTGMRAATRALLELAPTTKLLYSSDAHLFPELFYLGAKWARQVLGECLDEAVHNGDLTAGEADEVAEAVLRGNARRVYALAKDDS
jgi:uncharacterized protein